MLSSASILSIHMKKCCAFWFSSKSLLESFFLQYVFQWNKKTHEFFYAITLVLFSCSFLFVCLFVCQLTRIFEVFYVCVCFYFLFFLFWNMILFPIQQTVLHCSHSKIWFLTMFVCIFFFQTVCMYRTIFRCWLLLVNI